MFVSMEVLRLRLSKSVLGGLSTFTVGHASYTVEVLKVSHSFYADDVRTTQLGLFDLSKSSSGEGSFYLASVEQLWTGNTSSGLAKSQIRTSPEGTTHTRRVCGHYGSETFRAGFLGFEIRGRFVTLWIGQFNVRTC